MLFNNCCSIAANTSSSGLTHKDQVCISGSPLLSCASTTVKFHLRNVLQKFGVETRSQLQQLPNDWDLEPGKIDHFSVGKNFPVLRHRVGQAVTYIPFS